MKIFNDKKEKPNKNYTYICVQFISLCKENIKNKKETCKNVNKNKI